MGPGRATCDLCSTGLFDTAAIGGDPGGTALPADLRGAVWRLFPQQSDAQRRGRHGPQFPLPAKDRRRLRGRDRVGRPASDRQHRGQYRAPAAAFLAATGRKTSAHFSLHGHEWLFLVIAGALIALGLFAITPPGRRLFREKVWGFLRSAGSTVAGVAKSPRHVSLIATGAFGWPMVEVVAFALCVHAVGGTLPFVQVAAIYLGGSLVASIAPVPGGLGAL